MATLTRREFGRVAASAGASAFATLAYGRPTARVWASSVDRVQRMSELSPVEFTPGENPESEASGRIEKIFYPLVCTVVILLLIPAVAPLMGMFMLGNLMKESGVVGRLSKASENEIANVVTLFLGISIGATMEGRAFLTPTTLMILAFGFVDNCLDTACGVLFGKLMNVMTGGKISPLIGAAGISAYPMAARIVQKEGLKYNKYNFVLMHAVGANTGGQCGSVMAAAIMLSVLQGMGIIQ